MWVCDCDSSPGKCLETPKWHILFQPHASTDSEVSEAIDFQFHYCPVPFFRSKIAKDSVPFCKIEIKAQLLANNLLRIVVIIDIERQAVRKKGKAPKSLTQSGFPLSPY
jgi:hypothetical protein